MDIDGPEPSDPDLPDPDLPDPDLPDPDLPDPDLPESLEHHKLPALRAIYPYLYHHYQTD